MNNPNNLGAVLRTADWFGFRTVLISAGSCEATNPKVVRTSMGSLFHLTLFEGVDFERLLPGLRGRFRIVGSDVREGVPPHPCAAGTALLMGSESHGLPAPLLALTDEKWRIPGGGGAESLSLPQAAAIMMYECTRKLEKPAAGPVFDMTALPSVNRRINVLMSGVLHGRLTCSVRRGVKHFQPVNEYS